MTFSITRLLNRNNFINIIILSSIWLLAIILVGPLGDFPLNDDWCYGKTVKNFVEKGEFKLYDWGAPTQFAQTMWGALFCLPFGFSFTALRFSTLVLGLAGVLAIYGILRETRANMIHSFWGAFIIAMNPIYFALSNTFMTDVPFIAFAAVSIYFYIRALNMSSLAETAIATFFSCAATLTRQIGVAIPVSFTIAYFIKEQGKNSFSPISTRKNKAFRTISILLKAITPSVIVFGILITYIKILQSIDSFPIAASTNSSLFERFNKMTSQGFLAVFLDLLSNTLSVFTYLGLFLLPMLLIRKSPKWGQLKKKEIITIIIAVFLLSIAIFEVVIHQRRLMPFQYFGGNIIENFRLSPSTLKDVFLMGKPHLPKAPHLLWLMVTIAGMMGGFLLLKIIVPEIYRVFQKQEDISTQSRRYLPVLAISATLLLFAPLPPFLLFDRYIIPLLPTLLIIIVAQDKPEEPKPAKGMYRTSTVIMFLFAVFSICGTHDFLSWNKARWSALHYLTDEQGISPHSIDGGFEFNGWHLYGIVDQPKDRRSWWWVDDDEYLIAFGDIKHYDEIKKFKYKRWLPPDSARIYALKRRNARKPKTDAQNPSSLGDVGTEEKKRTGQ
jgi:4-amino-4-deoxy-L-arabinose transferase-like glycosyltransferase